MKYFKIIINILFESLKGGIPLPKQLKYFEEYIEKLNDMVGEERTKFILKNSMFVIICGSNDIANDFFGLPSVRLQYTVDSFTALMAENARSFAMVMTNVIYLLLAYNKVMLTLLILITVYYN